MDHMTKLVFVLFLFAEIGCAGSNPETVDANNPDVSDVSVSEDPGPDDADTRDVLAPDDAGVDVPDYEHPGDIVDTGSGDADVCEHWHYFMDGKYGEQCWDPPENLCKNGDNLETSWYCKPDGSLCCLTASSRCFHCGWIECGPGIEIVSDECQAIDIPERFLECLADGYCAVNSPDVYAEMTGGECEFSIDANYMVCWDDHI